MPGSGAARKGVIPFMEQTKKSLASRIPSKVWLLISFLAAMAAWFALSIIPATSRAFPNVFVTIEGLLTMIERGGFWQDLSSSMISVFAGYALGFVIALPVAILMAWYVPVRNILEPWIQFIRNIPPLAYVFLIIAALGIGQVSKVTVIFIAAFLVMVITIYQGVKGVDTTLIKAARVLGAKQTDIFFKITIPASTPFILVAARLGLSTSLTTLMASEIVGGDKGIGMMIQRASGYYQMDVVLMGIILLGIIGIIFEKIVKFLERRFTGWQETIQQ